MKLLTYPSFPLKTSFDSKAIFPSTIINLTKFDTNGFASIPPNKRNCCQRPVFRKKGMISHANLSTSSELGQSLIIVCNRFSACGGVTLHFFILR